MNTQVLVFPQNNDVIVLAHYGPEITDNTGMIAEFYYKDNRYTDDGDPSVQIYESSVDEDPDYPGQFMSRFSIPRDQNQVPNTYWWRIDVLDVADNRRTANCGTLLVEAV